MSESIRDPAVAAYRQLDDIFGSKEFPKAPSEVLLKKINGQFGFEKKGTTFTERMARAISKTFNNDYRDTHAVEKIAPGIIALFRTASEGVRDATKLDNLSKYEKAYNAIMDNVIKKKTKLSLGQEIKQAVLKKWKRPQEKRPETYQYKSSVISTMIENKSKVSGFQERIEYLTPRFKDDRNFAKFSAAWESQTAPLGKKLEQMAEFQAIESKITKLEERLVGFEKIEVDENQRTVNSMLMITSSKIIEAQRYEGLASSIPQWKGLSVAFNSRFESINEMEISPSKKLKQLEELTSDIDKLSKQLSSAIAAQKKMG
jgi:hypothetical protein